MQENNRNQDLRAQSLKVASQNGLVEAEAFAGLLPHPEYMERYEAILPGLANRMMLHFETEAQHRREIELQVVRSREAERIREAHYKSRGQIIAATLSLTLVGFASVLSFYGHETVAGIIATTSLGAVITAFVVGAKGLVKPPPKA
jgi:uncharacterized membrane protein